MPLHAVDVHLDVLCYAPRDTPLSDLIAEFVRPALWSQLQVSPRMIVHPIITSSQNTSPSCCRKLAANVVRSTLRKGEFANVLYN